jgi:cell wall-associated NlpC family hydrolase
VASHRRPKQASRVTTRATILTATAATALALASGSASADPKPTKKEAKAQLDKLSHSAETANEKYLGAKEKQKKLQKEVTRLQNQVADEQDDLNKLQDQVGKLASAEYRSGGIDPTVQLMLSSNPDDYLDKAQALDNVSDRQADKLTKVGAQKRVLDRKKATAERKLGDLEKSTKQAAKDKRTMQSKIRKAQTLLNSLTAAERAALQAEEAKAAQKSASGASAPKKSSGGGSSASQDDGPSVPASGRAGAAMAAARAQLGKPYSYGSVGPNSFDCSGLTGWAWRAAGVNLPRTSQAQAGVGRTINGLANAQPGDLIIYYPGSMSHVALYAGGGRILHAPRTGAVVRYEGASVMPIAKIVRPG